MPTPTGESLPLDDAPSFPTSAFPSHPQRHRHLQSSKHLTPQHQHQLEHQKHPSHHRHSLAQPDLELSELAPSSSRDTHRRIKHPKLRPDAPSSSSRTPESTHLLHPHPSSDSDYDSASSSELPHDSTDTQVQMSKRATKKTNRKSVARQSSSDSLHDTDTTGHANTTSTMNGIVEHRRKHASIDSNTSEAQAASLMGRSTFTLDDPVPSLQSGQQDEGPSKGFFELSKKDQRNFLLLVLLYFLQGIPMGLATGSVPFLLKSVVSYSSIGIFSLAAYPYSLKLFWSPIVDAVWTPKLGRRKSWILPIQTISGFSMIWLGSRVNAMMESAGHEDGSGMWSFTWWWFALVFLCATQDIAVDGKKDSISDVEVDLTEVRLGFDPSLGRESRICIDCTDSWSHRRTVPLIHRFPCFQLKGVR